MSLAKGLSYARRPVEVNESKWRRLLCPARLIDFSQPIHGTSIPRSMECRTKGMPADRRERRHYGGYLEAIWRKAQSLESVGP